MYRFQPLSKLIQLLGAVPNQSWSVKLYSCWKCAWFVIHSTAPQCKICSLRLISKVELSCVNIILSCLGFAEWFAPEFRESCARDQSFAPTQPPPPEMKTSKKLHKSDPKDQEQKVLVASAPAANDASDSSLLADGSTALAMVSYPIGAKPVQEGEADDLENDVPAPDMLFNPPMDRMVPLPSLASDVSHPTATPTVKPAKYKVVLSAIFIFFF